MRTENAPPKPSAHGIAERSVTSPSDAPLSLLMNTLQETAGVIPKVGGHNGPSSKETPSSPQEQEPAQQKARHAARNGMNLSGLFRDTAKREALEARLRQVGKEEALQILAGAIAHDFNNELGTILGFAQLAIASLSKGSNAHDDLTKALEAGERASNLVLGMLDFSRETQFEALPEREDVRAACPSGERLLAQNQNKVSLQDE